MAHYDHAAAREKQLWKETYESLKEWIAKDGKKYNRALSHMISIESKIKQQEEIINEYYVFFEKLKSFLPK